MKTLVIFDLDETLIMSNKDDHDVHEILGKLLEKGVTMAVASRNDEYVALRRLEKENIVGFFDMIVADFRPKTFQVRDIVHSLAEKGAQFDRIMFVDDSESNIQDVRKRVPSVECYHFGKDITSLGDLEEIVLTQTNRQGQIANNTDNQ